MISKFCVDMWQSVTATAGLRIATVRPGLALHSRSFVAMPLRTAEILVPRLFRLGAPKARSAVEGSVIDCCGFALHCFHSSS